MDQSVKRHLAKTITWRIVGTVDTMLLGWIVSGDLKIGLSVGGLELLTKMGLYYIHERVWYKSNFGLNDRRSVKTQVKMKNLTKHDYTIGIDQRKELKGHKPFLIWFTGLSGSGKSTLANLLEIELHKLSIHTYLLDGDNIRLGLNKDLTFSDSDRSENIRRIGEVSNLMVDAGIITIAAFVSPFQKDRDLVRSIVGKDNYLEIFVNTPLEVCIERDTKGLYKKAIAGEISDFTGISSPFEMPVFPNLTINTAILTTDEAIDLILSEVLKKLKLR